MAKKSEVKLFAFLGTPGGPWDKAPYKTGVEIEAAIAAAQADSETSEIDFLINSGGGANTDASLITASLERCTKPTKAIIQGYAASNGLFVAYGCKWVSATRNSIIMPHGVQSAARGSVQDIEAHVEAMKTHNKAMAQLMVKRTGLTEDEVIAKFLSKDTYMTAQEAFDAKLIDEVIDVDAEFDAVEFTAEMPYGAFHSSLHAKLSGANDENWWEKIVAGVESVFGIPRKPAPVSAVVTLTDSEGWNIADMIYGLKNANSAAGYLINSTSNSDVKTKAQNVQATTAQAIIDLTVMLYTDQTVDATVIEARVQEQCAKISSKHSSQVMSTIKPEIDAKIVAAVQPIQAQYDDLKVKYDAIKDEAGADLSGAKRESITKPENIVDDSNISDDGKRINAINNFSFITARVPE